MMKQLKIAFLSILIILTSCAGPEEKKEEQRQTDPTEVITLKEAELFGQNQTRLDNRKALELIRLYEAYANEHPDDSLSPEYLFRAADISMNMRRPKETIKLFDKIIVTYPDHEKTPSVIFLKAFVYEDQLQDLEEAKVYYELYLQKYPDGEFSDDAEVSMQNLGKTPEELIREFEENQQ